MGGGNLSGSIDTEDGEEGELPDEPLLDSIINDLMKELHEKTYDPEVNKFLLRTTSI
jgi:hypothetical protein